MSVVDDFLKKMKMVSDDDDDEYDEYEDEDSEEGEDDEYEDEEEAAPKKKSGLRSLFSRKPKPVKEEEGEEEEEEEEDDEEEEDSTSSYNPSPAPVKKPSYTQPQKSNVVGMNARPAKSGNAPEVVMIMPKSFEDANTIADVLLSRKAVVLNLEGIDLTAAQRIVDFASGSCYTVGGSLQKISKKIFIVVPRDMTLSGDFDDMIGDMIDLDSVNMMK